MSRWIYYNPNPRGSVVGDCTVRAISKAMDQDWETTYAGLSSLGYALSDMPSANHVWGAYLRRNGFERRLINDHGKDIYTVEDFCKDNPKGTFILAIPGHVVCLFGRQRSFDRLAFQVWNGRSFFVYLVALNLLQLYQKCMKI